MIFIFMNKKSYSIVIPCFNSEKYLEKCLKSIYLFNKIKDFEIVIINDCSTDDTLKIILRYKKIYSNLILIDNNKQTIYPISN